MSEIAEFMGVIISLFFVFTVFGALIFKNRLTSTGK